MKDILGTEIRVGDKLAIARSGGEGLYLATVEEIRNQTGYLPVVVLRLKSCGRLQEDKLHRVARKAVVVARRAGRDGATVEVYLDGADSPAFSTTHPVRVFVRYPEGDAHALEVPGGPEETSQTQAEG